MKQKLIKVLQDTFEAPEPQRKQAFLREISSFRISYWKFICIQAAYIRKRIWVLSAAIFIVAVISGCFMKKETVWILSALMPFLALSSITENIRSEVYGMAELEISSAFSLKSVVLARIGILGLSNLVLLSLIALLEYAVGVSAILQTGVYLLVPYLLTAGGGLWLFRKINGREALYASGGLAVMIGIFPLLSRYMMSFLYQPEVFGWWLAALVLLCFLTGCEYQKTVKRTEEFTWSL